MPGWGETERKRELNCKQTSFLPSFFPLFEPDVFLFFKRLSELTANLLPSFLPVAIYLGEHTANLLPSFLPVPAFTCYSTRGETLSKSVNNLTSQSGGVLVSAPMRISNLRGLPMLQS